MVAVSDSSSSFNSGTKFFDFQLIIKNCDISQKQLNLVFQVMNNIMKKKYFLFKDKRRSF
jgi:hypothetical protein